MAGDLAPFAIEQQRRRQAEGAQLLRDPAAFVDVAREIFDADVGIERIDGSDAGPVDGKRNDCEIRPAERCLQAIREIGRAAWREKVGPYVENSGGGR